MFYLQNLRVRLQDRRNRLHRCEHRTFQTELRYLLGYLEGNPYVQGLLTSIDAAEPTEFATWVDTAFSSSRPVRFPSTEVGRAKMCLGILKQCADDAGNNPLFFWGRQFGGNVDLTEACRSVAENVVDPLINCLHDLIDEAGNVLFILQRFKWKTEWFTRDHLYEQYVENTSVGEAHLDKALRLGLFELGIDYPFSQPSSPSGKADVVALLGSDDPMVLEVKVFDPGRNRGVPHLRQGFHQVLRYANDYDENVGYLVVYNCSDRQLIVTDTASQQAESPSRIKHANKTIFVFVIDVNPDTASASKENPSNRQVIDQQDLIGTRISPKGAH